VKTRPVRVARVAFGHGGCNDHDQRHGEPPNAVHGEGTPAAAPLIRTRIDGLAHARQVFLAGTGLPERWAGRPTFVVLETAFGVIDNFLATWDAWRRDPQRCERLFFVAVTPHPPRRADLARGAAASALPDLAAALSTAWPPLTANLHPLAFEGGRVRLLLGLGDMAALLPELQLTADAFYLHDDGLTGTSAAARWDRHQVKALARAAAPGARLAANGTAPGLHDGLMAAGFDVERRPGDGGASEATLATYVPRFTARSASRPAPPSVAVSQAQPAAPSAPSAREALVIGAGLAGASAAAALADLGWAVQVIDRHAAPAAETSGNAAGLYHGTLHPGDGLHARLFRAAALAAERCLQPLLERGVVPGGRGGLLRMHAGALQTMQALIDAQRLPPDYVQALSAADASACAGVPMHSPAWWFPGGGWVAPAALVQNWLRTPGVHYSGNVEVAALRPGGAGWQALDAHGEMLAQAPVLVLANAADAQRLLAPLGHKAWPLQRSRGQVSGWHGAGSALRLPVAGDGYALPLPAGGVLCGATADIDDHEPGPRGGDDARNFERLQRLTGLTPPADRSGHFSRVGWRLQADDRLPVVGPVALPAQQIPSGTRLDQPRFVPRSPGLFVLTGLGARGITLAPLMGALLAARIAGTPWPLERGLVEAVDPVRWIVRQARRAAG